MKKSIKKILGLATGLAAIVALLPATGVSFCRRRWAAKPVHT